jgi:hypothetical protein
MIFLQGQLCATKRPVPGTAEPAKKGQVWDGDWGLTEALFSRGPGILSRSANL